MDIRIVEDKSAWDQWNISQGSAEFLQSWDWGAFQDAAGHEVRRYQLLENGEVQAQIQGFLLRLPFGQSFFYAPRVNFGGAKAVQSLSKHLRSTEKAIFLRAEPDAETMAVPDDGVPTGTRQPAQTLMLDLSLSEDELLASMHSKTRYNIRLADKKGVEIREGKNVDWFWQLHQETTNRDGFSGHNNAYYEKMIAMPICHQLTAFYNDQPIASNIFVAWGGRCTYLHGASSNTHRNVMAPYLLQWRGIQMAKQFGNTTYDFWGISPEASGDQPETSFNGFTWQADHKWTGVTRFKVGFGGKRHAYGGAFEVPLRPIPYKLLRFVKKFV